MHVFWRPFVAARFPNAFAMLYSHAIRPHDGSSEPFNILMHYTFLHESSYGRRIIHALRKSLLLFRRSNDLYIFSTCRRSTTASYAAQAGLCPVNEEANDGKDNEEDDDDSEHDEVALHCCGG